MLVHKAPPVVLPGTELLIVRHSLRWYDPDQVIGYNLRPKQATPRTIPAYRLETFVSRKPNRQHRRKIGNTLTRNHPFAVVPIFLLAPVFPRICFRDTGYGTGVREFCVTGRVGWIQGPKRWTAFDFDLETAKSFPQITPFSV